MMCILRYRSHGFISSVQSTDSIVLSNLVRLDKERLDKEQLDNSEPFPVTNNLINSEQIGFSEQLCNSQKVPYYQV